MVWTLGSTRNPSAVGDAVAALAAGTNSDVYNWKASNTRALQRSMGAAVAGTGLSEHLVIGDLTSQESPTQSTYNHAAMWPRVLRGLLAARGIPLAGSGWVWAVDGSSGQYDPRVTKTGTWAAQSGNYAQSSSAGTLTFTSDAPGTIVKVAYFNTSAAFDVSIDGGTPVTVTPAGGSTVGVYSVTGLDNIPHEVTVTTDSSSNRFIIAFAVTSASGVSINNLGTHNLYAATAAGSSTFPNAIFSRATLIPTPDVVHLPVGMLDINNGNDPSTVTAALTTLRDRYSSADCILYIQAQVSGKTWSAYEQVMYALADVLDCPLIDLNTRWGGYTAANTNGMMGDAVCPSVKAHGDWGLLVANTLLRAV